VQKVITFASIVNGDFDQTANFSNIFLTIPLHWSC